jgi:NADH-quinone oxidoreductase subunit A
MSTGYQDPSNGSGFARFAKRSGLPSMTLWPLALYLVAVLGTAASMILLSHFLGSRHSEPRTGEPFESGVPGTGTARLRFPVKFYWVAMFFVIFDLEAAYLFAWAVALRELGWAGYAGAAVFMGVLLAALLYLWRTGALEWAPGADKT